MEPVASLFAPRSIPFSVEMFPPKGSLTLDAARKVVGGMALARPDFIGRRLGQRRPDHRGGLAHPK